MTNIFQQAEAMLRAARVSAMQEDITYVGGDLYASGIVSTLTKATRGKSVRESIDGDNVVIVTQTIDWLIDDLRLALATKHMEDSVDDEEPITSIDELDLDEFSPAVGHYIIDSQGRRYSVCGTPCYREHGSDGKTLRVYTQEINKIEETPEDE